MRRLFYILFAIPLLTLAQPVSVHTATSFWDVTLKGVHSGYAPTDYQDFYLDDLSGGLTGSNVWLTYDRFRADTTYRKLATDADSVSMRILALPGMKTTSYFMSCPTDTITVVGYGTGGKFTPDYIFNDTTYRTSSFVRVPLDSLIHVAGLYRKIVTDSTDKANYRIVNFSYNAIRVIVTTDSKNNKVKGSRAIIGVNAVPGQPGTYGTPVRN